MATSVAGWDGKGWEVCFLQVWGGGLLGWMERGGGGGGVFGVIFVYIFCIVFLYL